MQWIIVSLAVQSPCVQGTDLSWHFSSSFLPPFSGLHMGLWFSFKLYDTVPIVNLNLLLVWQRSSCLFYEKRMLTSTQFFSSSIWQCNYIWRVVQTIHLLKDLAYSMYFSLGFDLLSTWKIIQIWLRHYHQYSKSANFYFTLNYWFYI